MMGVAVGCVGMSLPDFCALSLSEFSTVYRQWADAREAGERGEWERTRLLATFAVQPYSKKKLQPKDLLVFPWEQPEKKNAGNPGRSTAERFKELTEKFG